MELFLLSTFEGVCTGRFGCGVRDFQAAFSRVSGKSGNKERMWRGSGTNTLWNLTCMCVECDVTSFPRVGFAIPLRCEPIIYFFTHTQF